MTLATLATLAALMTGSPCAAIDNGPNAAAWAVPGHRTVTATYADMGDDLQYSRAIPRRALPAAIAAEDSLTIGKPGHKLRIACTD